jgi:hypothetical protein
MVGSRCAAASSIAAKVGCTAQSLNSDRDCREAEGSGAGAGELRQVHEILRKSVGVFCLGGARPPVQTMIAFIDDQRKAGACQTDNAAERALRGLGRKAWLFTGSDRGAERAAIM